MSKSRESIIKNQLHVEDGLQTLFGAAFCLGTDGSRERDSNFLPNYWVACVLTRSSAATLSRRKGRFISGCDAVCS